jgi:hypothetical protein
MVTGERGFGSRILSEVSVLTPLDQKHAVRIRTGNLMLLKRNTLTAEPQQQIVDNTIRNIAVYEVELQIKNAIHKTW